MSWKQSHLSLGLLHRLASKNLSLFCTHIELPQPHSRLSFNMFIRPLLSELHYQCINANIWPQDSNQSPRYLLNNSQAVLAKASHPHPAPSKIQDPLNMESDASCSAHRQSFVFTPSNPCHRRAGHQAIRDCGRLKYTLVQNCEHVARRGLPGFSSQFTAVRLLLYLLTLLASIYLAEFHPFNAGFS